MLCYAILRYAVLCYAIPCYSAMLCYAVPCFVIALTLFSFGWHPYVVVFLAAMLLCWLTITHSAIAVALVLLAGNDACVTVA